MVELLEERNQYKIDIIQGKKALPISYADYS